MKFYALISLVSLHTSTVATLRSFHKTYIGGQVQVSRVSWMLGEAPSGVITGVQSDTLEIEDDRNAVEHDLPGLTIQCKGT